MTDLERFFRHLVRTLSATDPARLWQGIPLAEISGTIMPYRSHRRALELDSSEDYEVVLMRLGAGEGGYVHLSPDDARAQVERELGSPNPDLGVLRRLADAVVHLEPGRIAMALTALTADGETPAEPIVEAEAPVELLDALLPTSEPEPASTPNSASAPDPALDSGAARISSTSDTFAANVAAPAVHCLTCGEALPSDRRIKFCPYCGEGLAPAQCTACGMALDPAWRFCAGCGHSTAGRPVGRRRT